MKSSRLLPPASRAFLLTAVPREPARRGAGRSLPICFLLAAANFMSHAAVTNNLPELTSAAAVRLLSPAQAALHYPTRLSGLITFFDATQFYRFFQDDTAGIYFNIEPSPEPPFLADGELIQIEGVTDKGEYAPTVIAKKITVLGRGEFPKAKPVSYDQLVSGQEDSQFVEIRGIVRAVRQDEAGNHLVEIVTSGERLTALIRNLPAAESERLPDSIVLVHGVCAPRFNRQNQLFDNWLLVPRPQDFIIEQPAPENPFADPAHSIGSLLKFNPTATFGHRILVQGTVSSRPDDGNLFLTDPSGDLQVLTAQPGALQPGDQLQVLGFLAFGSYTPMIQDAVFRKTGSGLPPLATPISVDAALQGTFDCHLVRMKATVLDRAVHGPEPFLVLQSGGFIFHAQFDSEADGKSFSHLHNDTLVAVTGICRVQKGENWRAGDAWRAKSFFIELRSPDDVAVLKLPPWWTLQKLLWIIGILALVVFGISAWVAALRRRVELLQQREVLQRERIRISQDIHDEIGSKLAKISYLSDAVTRETAETNISAGKIISIAHTSRDLLSSLDRTVWAVNPSNDSLEQLVNYLGQYATEYFQDTPIQCQLQLPRSLPAITFFSEVRHDVLLAFEEVLSNIVKHSGATSVQVRMTLTDAIFEVFVEDNGSGFATKKFTTHAADTSNKLAVPRHGLTGLQRRLTNVGGRYELKSESGGGTSVRFIIPLKNISKAKT